MRILSVLSTVVVLSILSGGATAQERSGRYVMNPTENGFVRLDTETGAMSLCARKDGNWACEAMDDPARRLRQENERLAAENSALKAEVSRLEQLAAKPGEKLLPDPGGERPGGKLELPSDREVDQALDYVERMYRKFRDRLKRLESEERKGTPL